MSTPKLVKGFYERIWNDGNWDAAAELLTPESSFRGSMGQDYFYEVYEDTDKVAALDAYLPGREFSRTA